MVAQHCLLQQEPAMFVTFLLAARPEQCGVEDEHCVHMHLEMEQQRRVELDKAMARHCVHVALSLSSRLGITMAPRTDAAIAQQTKVKNREVQNEASVRMVASKCVRLRFVCLE